jgi:thymidylate synthase (FAD)
MKIIESKSLLLYPDTKEDWNRELHLIELAGRTAYKSEEKITENSALPFIANIVRRNHLAVIEFGNMVVKFITDRGITHELVRHRLCSFIQESTRYCNYNSGKFGNEVSFIKPSTWDTWEKSAKDKWLHGIDRAEDFYLMLVEKPAGLTPQQARAILPNSTKAEIIIKANFREWRHIFQLRAVEKYAHPDMRKLMIPLYQICREKCPEVFDLGDPEVE